MKYKTVVIDPPWPIAFESSGRTNILREKREGIKYKKYDDFKQQDELYDVSTIEDIFNFPINDFADDALLFLWVTCGKIKGRPVIDIGFDIIDKWGFTYHSIITWVKPNNHAIFSPLLCQTEHVLFAWRGNFANLTNKQNGVMKNVLIERGYQIKHSEKPARFYQLLRAWTPTPRIDIFARNAHEGFDGWGDEYVGEGPLAPYLKEKMK